MTGPCIVMFEDDPGYIKTYSAALVHGGFRVCAFSYPPENLIDVVVDNDAVCMSMDINMPHMDGLTAAKLLKHDKRTKEIPLVFLTSLDVDEYRHDADGIGAVAYFVKGKITPAEYAESIKRLLAKSLRS